MSSRKIVIIDSDPGSREILRFLLQSVCPDALIVHEFSSAQEFNSTDIAPFDIAFIDVQLADGDGLAFVAKLDEISFAIIFTMAWNEWAIRQFRLHGFSHLLKPVNPEELREAIATPIVPFSQSQHELVRSLVSEPCEAHSPQSPGRKLAIPTDAGVSFIALCEITSFESMGNFTRIVLCDNTIVIAQKLFRDYEDLLRDYHFSRINQGAIVNLYKIKTLVNNGSAVEMTNGARLEVASQRVAGLRKALAGLEAVKRTA